ncbi:TerB family tellurite resistance protein [Thalassotalea sp. M1531]|uniref:TerB family tellurite resistance protein n=1 Tax=Thalassotalea algicola TaxID=2716224 RepID=A0A7Y0Q891_9GAMM|nr:TerB family tellurite resistance protein [Thalassotalea algicola]NMP31880.1 TerB family tellurite resistance protein [Thalassotalea algicola]
MLNKIQRFFDDILANEQVSSDELSLDIACAVLLVEVMKADGLITNEEQQHVATVLTKHFPLTPIEVDDLINAAIELSENANDFYRFTSTINKQYSPEQKVHMVEILWQLALADGELAAVEQHIIRKIADLLHLRHNEYMQAKTNALNAQDQSS